MHFFFSAEVMFVEEGIDLHLHCSSLVDLRAAIKNGNHSQEAADNFEEIMSELQVFTISVILSKGETPVPD